MPLIDGVKYACAACIKGHRSSACQHVDRPIFEIKKKGRPSTLCACKKARRGTTSKCACKEDKADPVANDLKVVGPNSKALRAIRKATIEKAYMCSCLQGGSCGCAQTISNLELDSVTASSSSSMENSSRSRRNSRHKSMPSTSASTISLSEHSCCSTVSTSPLDLSALLEPDIQSSLPSLPSIPETPFTTSSQNPPSITALDHGQMITFPQPTTAAPCSTLNTPIVDAKQPLNDLLFNDWIFGDVMIPESMIPPAPSNLQPGECVGCPPGCMCGDKCQCSHVQALHQSLLFDSFSPLPIADPDPTLTPLSTIDQAFLDAIFPPQPQTTVRDWQKTLPLGQVESLLTPHFPENSIDPMLSLSTLPQAGMKESPGGCCSKEKSS